MSNAEFLAQLSKAYVDSASKSFLEKVKKFWLKKQYGITINVDEASSIKTIAETPLFLIFKRYLGNHWSSDLIKVGLFVLGLNDEGKKERVKQISDDAYKNKRYGKRGRRIIQLASTGILSIVMQHIIDLKLEKNTNENDLQKEFDKILDEWEQISIPIKWDTIQNEIEKEIIGRMKQNYPVFFVYAAGSATGKTLLTIANMQNQGIFKEKYIPFPKHKSINNIDYCLWVFEKVEVSEESLISKEVKK